MGQEILNVFIIKKKINARVIFKLDKDSKILEYNNEHNHLVNDLEAPLSIVKNKIKNEIKNSSNIFNLKPKLYMIIYQIKVDYYFPNIIQ